MLAVYTQFVWHFLYISKLIYYVCVFRLHINVFLNNGIENVTVMQSFLSYIAMKVLRFTFFCGTKLEPVITMISRAGFDCSLVYVISVVDELHWNGFFHTIVVHRFSTVRNFPIIYSSLRILPTRDKCRSPGILKKLHPFRNLRVWKLLFTFLSITMKLQYRNGVWFDLRHILYKLHGLTLAPGCRWGVRHWWGEGCCLFHMRVSLN